jgi:hypothetical protein
MDSLYHFTAVCGGVLGVTTCPYRIKMTGKLEDRVPFIPVPKTSPLVGVLDPCGDPEGYSRNLKN